MRGQSFGCLLIHVSKYICHLSTSASSQSNERTRWHLHSKEPKSVIFENFGNVIVIAKQQLIEVAMGLASSIHQCLWINGHDLVTGDTTILPSEFEVKANGKL